MLEVVRRWDGGDVGAHYVRAIGDDHGTHAHAEVQIFVAVAGHGFRATADGGMRGRRIDFAPGEIHVVAAGQAHRFDWAVAEMTSLFLRRERMNAVLGGAFPRVPAIGDCWRLSDPAIVHTAAQFAAFPGRELEPLLIETIVDDIVIRIGERISGTAARVYDGSRRRWHRLRDYVDASLGERIGVADLARIADVPLHALGAFVRRHSGRSPYRFVCERRLAAARLLLLGTHPLAEIAVTAGFAHQSHFTQAFRAAFGLTPARFRRTFRDGIR